MTDNDKHIEPSLTPKEDEEFDLDLENSQETNNDDINFDESDFNNGSDNDIDLGDFESVEEKTEENHLSDNLDLDNGHKEDQTNEVANKNDENISNDHISPLDNLVKIQTDTINHLDKLISTSEKFLPDIVNIKNEMVNIKEKLNEIEINLNNKIDNLNANAGTSSPDSNNADEEISIFQKSETSTYDDSGLLKPSKPSLESSDVSKEVTSEQYSEPELSKPEIEKVKDKESDTADEVIENEEVKTKTVTQLTPLGSFIIIFVFLLFIMGLLAFVDKTSGLPNVGIIKILKPAFKLFEPLLFFL